MFVSYDRKGVLRNECTRFLVCVLVLHDDMVHCPRITDVQLGVLFAQEQCHQSDLIGEGDTHTKEATESYNSTILLQNI